MVTCEQIEIISKGEIPSDMTRDEVNQYCAINLANLFLGAAQGRRLQSLDDSEPSGWYTYTHVIPLINPLETHKWRLEPEYD